MRLLIRESLEMTLTDSPLDKNILVHCITYVRYVDREEEMRDGDESFSVSFQCVSVQLRFRYTF